MAHGLSKPGITILMRRVSFCLMEADSFQLAEPVASVRVMLQAQQCWNFYFLILKSIFVFQMCA